ncbi:MAG: hypothetical protein MUC96_26850 [Myxococcaceae bacterium]|jgi:hypothetical protein|nr:hypothetical protein [Myxococcaceae bacterium]
MIRPLVMAWWLAIDGGTSATMDAAVPTDRALSAEDLEVVKNLELLENLDSTADLELLEELSLSR